jgi:hypothetical protein
MELICYAYKIVVWKNLIKRGTADLIFLNALQNKYLRIPGRNALPGLVTLFCAIPGLFILSVFAAAHKS